MKKKGIKFFLRILVLSLISIALTWLATWISEKMVSQPIQRLENALYDNVLKYRSHNDQFKTISTNDVAIIEIDDASIRELGRVQSWPRKYDADVINYVDSGGAIAIGIDFLYTESDTLPNVYKDILRKGGISNPTQVIKSLSTDQALSEAIGKSQKVYLSLWNERNDTSQTFNADRSVLRLLKFNDDVKNNFTKIGIPQLPISIFAQKAKAIGGIEMPTDVDGVVRSYQVVSRLSKTENSYLGNFPLYIIIDLLGVQESDIKIKNSKIVLQDSFQIPVNSQGAFRINWLGTEDKVRKIPFYKVLNKIVPAEYFKDKVIFFGASAAGLEDLKTVPHTEDRFPGVDIHVTAFLNMINQAWIKEVSFKNFILLALLACLITAFLFTYTKPLYAILWLAAILLSQIFSIFPIFNSMHTMIPIVSLMMSTLITGMITNTYNYFAEQKQKIQLKSAFGTYVSSTVVNKIIEDPKSLMLGGTKKTLSVLFSDIRGFTKYSEYMDPQLVVSIINKYLSAMSEPVLAHEGTIDKFIGDAIFAIFGAPLENSDHATEACEVALEMINKLKDVNQYLISEGYGPLKIGIGLNTGEMTIGNIGSSKRFDYTAIGDSVNLGSRIEGLTKHFNTNILVSEFTKNACDQSQFLFRALPETAVQGKAKTVGIFELVDYQKNREHHEPFISTWENALVKFFLKDFKGAYSLFESYYEKFPNDVSAMIYMEKCKTYQSHPEEFNNSIVMENK